MRYSNERFHLLVGYTIRSVLVIFANVTFSDAPDSYYYRTAKVGQTVKFPCPTNLHEDIDWMYFDDMQSGEKYIYLSNIGLVAFGLKRRFAVLDKNESYSLVIHNVTVNDSGYYRCVEDNGLGKRHFFGLTVQGISFNLVNFYSVEKRKVDAYASSDSV